MNEQFMRTELLLGANAMKRLGVAHVMICGVGAVGGTAAEIIARTGVRHITLVDFDIVEISNINRQIVALHSTIGMKKIDVMRARILDINPECNVVTHDIKITPDNAAEILVNNKPIMVLDAIDDVAAKVALIESCINANIPIISSMGAAMRDDLSRVRVGTIGQSRGCPLARAVRTGLRTGGVETSRAMCVYSDQEIPKTTASARDTSGTLPSAPAMTTTIGARLADAGIKLLIGK